MDIYKINDIAALITFRTYNTRNPGHTGSYIKLFSLMNFGFLAVLLVFSMMIGF